MKRTWALGAVTVALVALAGCGGGGGGGGGEIKFGVVGPETGGAAQLGQAQRQAVEMAVAEINAKGGVNGKKLVALFEDDEGSPTKSANATSKLINQEKVVALHGAIHSSATLADMVITAKAGIPQITSGSAGEGVTAQGNPWIFRTAPNDRFQAGVLVDLAKNRFKFSKVALMTGADDYGQSGRKLLKEEATKAGLQVVADETFNLGDKDFKGQLVKVKDSGAQAIYIWCPYTEAALIARQARELGLAAQLMAGSGPASAKLMELGGQAVEGMILTQTFLPDNPDTTVQEFVKNYKAKYKIDPIPHAAQAYDTVYVLADAIKRVGGTEPAKLRDAIRATNGLPGVTGKAKFNEAGDDVGKNILKTVIKGGQFKLLDN